MARILAFHNLFLNVTAVFSALNNYDELGTSCVAAQFLLVVLTLAIRLGNSLLATLNEAPDVLPLDP
jgi:hypothetical protein